MAKQQTLTIVVPDGLDDPVDLIHEVLFDRGYNPLSVEEYEHYGFTFDSDSVLILEEA